MSNSRLLGAVQSAKIFNIICGSLAILLLLNFFSYIWFNSFNLIYAPDDVRCILNQFVDYREGRYTNVLSFLLSKTLHPHPKITTRVLTLTSYYSLNEINLRFLQIIGNYFVPVFLVFINRWNERRSKFILIFLSFCVFLLPHQTTFWTISVTSIPFMYFFIAGAIHYFFEEKLYSAALFSFLAMFSSGQGFIVGFILCVILLLKLMANRSRPKLAEFVFLAVNLISVFLYYYIIHYDLRQQSSLSFEFSLHTFQNYFAFLSSHISATYFTKDDSIFYGCIIGVFMTASMIIFLWIKYKKDGLTKNDKKKIILLLYLAALSFLAVMSRLNKEVVLIAPRYEFHSLIFVVIYIFVLVDFIVERLNYNLLCGLAIVVGLIHFNANYDSFHRYSLTKFGKLNYLGRLLVEKPMPQLEKMILRSIEGGYYTIPTLDLSITSSEGCEEVNLGFSMIGDYHISETINKKRKETVSIYCKELNVEYGVQLNPRMKYIILDSKKYDCDKLSYCYN